jgi:tetratricopeptide (TPR) repeat protein
MTRVSLMLALLVTLAGSRLAVAQAPPDSEKRARELFAVGQYSQALEIYGRLYAETAHPTYLRNIGRCFQNLGEPDKAISSFREYLRQAKNLSVEQRTQVEGYIQEMEALKRQREALPPPPPPVPTAGVTAPRPVTVETTPAPVPSPPMDGRRVGAFAAAGAAVVAVGIGTVFGLRAISKRKDSDPLCPDDRCNQQGLALDHQAHTAAVVSDVTFGAGLLAAGAATYLFLTSGDQAPVASTGLRWRVALGPRAVGLGLGGQW